MDKRETNWISVGIFWLLCYLAIYVEGAFGGMRQLLGAQIDFLPGLMVFAGLSFRLNVILLTGAIFGLLLDSLSANPLGTSSIALSAVAFAIYQYRELLLGEQFTAHLVLGTIASAVAPLISIVVLFGVGEQPLVGFGSLLQLLIMATGGGVLTPVWFRLFSRFDRALRYKIASEGGFRSDRQIIHGRNW
jgi:cell shape-determining protein MreD